MRSAFRRAIGLPRWPSGGIVLAYHRVTTVAHDPHRLAVTPAHFAEHLDVITSQGVPMTLEAMVAAAQQGALPRRAVAVTFDDGYADNLQCAAPLLARAKVPATVFISTSACENGHQFWWDTSEPLATHRPLTLTEIAELARCEGITVGSHTHSHPSLASLPLDEQRREVTTARDLLESITGSRVTSFAYPFGGAEDVSDCTETIVREAGIAIACTTEPDSVRLGVKPHRVPRVIIRDWSRSEFLEQWSSWTQ